MKKFLLVGLLLVTGVSFAGAGAGGGGRADPGNVIVNGAGAGGGGRADPG